MARADRKTTGVRSREEPESVGNSGAVRVHEAVAVPPHGKLLRRTEVARLLGVSKSTLRRMEGGTLTPVVGPKNVRLFHEEEVRAVLVTRRAHVESAADRGEIAAEAFALFDAGSHVVDVVKHLHVDPERVESLYSQWARLRGMLLLPPEARTEIATALLGWDDGKLKTASDVVAFVKKWVTDESIRQCVECKREWACFCRSCAKRWGLRAAKQQLDEDQARKL